MEKTELIETKKSAAGYLDGGDNVHANVIQWLDTTCAESDNQWFIPGKCENGHRYAKIVVCGKEWCSVCGKKGSMAHNRRYVRWLSKIMQFKSMRYITFTIPEHLRYRYRTKTSLTELGRRCQGMLKRHGYRRGLRRWHWFGDRYHKWHAHLNVLIEGPYMEQSELKSIKNAWARILKTDIVSVKISYKPKPEDMAGCLYYVTRSTFLDYNWDIEMAMELRNFRNMVVWGKNEWVNEPVWSISETGRIEKDQELDLLSLTDLMEHKCPRCGGHITWSDAMPAKLLYLQGHARLGAGYYVMIDGPGPPALPLPVKQKLVRLKMEWLLRCSFSGRNANRLDNVLYYYLN